MAQHPTVAQAAADRAVSAQDRRAVVDSVCVLLNRRYVFPDKAEAMAKILQEKLKKGKYDSLNVMAPFAEQLTNDMRSVTHDGHLAVIPASEPPPGTEDTLSPAESRKERFEFLKESNFGFTKAEILPGNIGLLQLDGFSMADVAAPTAVAAMNFHANCRALIVDLRQNGGGEPSMIQLITSYFFDRPVHLNSFYDRTTDSIAVQAPEAVFGSEQEQFDGRASDTFDEFQGNPP